MSHPYLEQLLQGVEVEWKALGEVADVCNSQRKPIKASLRKHGAIPYYGANNIQDYVEGYTHNGEYLLVAEDGSASLNKYSIQWVNGKFWANNHIHVLCGKEVLLNRFLFHYLKQMNFIPFLSGGKRAKLTKAKLVQIPIPIPPLPVQKEIVRILDTFTHATAELTAERSMRIKQYQYYREYLLSFSEHEVEWKTLGEVTKYEQPSKYLVASEKYNDSYETPVLTAGKTFILGYTNETEGIYYASQEPVIIFDDFTTANKWVSFDFKVKSSAIKLITSANEELVLLKYIYYWLNILPRTESTDHRRQWISNFMSKEIPIPPLEEQARIVAILDKFDTLTQSLSEGLPREIELRQKQYEYYREQLLSFES